MKFDKTSEEAKAIKRLNQIRQDYSINSEDLHYANILFYLLKNLTNENEKLKEKNKKLIEEQAESLEKLIIPELLKKYISKDKIREKIEEIQNEYFKILENNTLSLEIQNYNAQRYEAMRNVLEELLEE